MSTAPTSGDKRRLKGDASRKLILDSAATLIADHGYDGTSMAMIAKASGLPSSSIYWHFSSKEGVLAAVMQRGAERFFTQFSNTPWFSGSPVDRLTAALRHTGHNLLTNPDSRQFMMLQMRFRLARQNNTFSPELVKIADSVHADGKAFMKRWISDSFAEYGRTFADELADELASFGVSAMDGASLNALSFDLENGTDLDSLESLLNHTAEAITLMAKVRAEGVEHPDGKVTSK